MTDYLTVEDLLALIDDLRVGPVRDYGLLGSASHRPQVTVFGRDAYSGVDAKAAVLLESLVRNQPLVDGNRRLGWLAVVVFEGLNGCTLEAPDDDVYAFVVAVASGELSAARAAATLANWH